MGIGNLLGLISVALFALYFFGSHLPQGTVVANLRGISLLLTFPLSLIAGWKGSRAWWLISAGMIVMAIVYFVALGEHR